MADVLIVGGAGTGWATAHYLAVLDPSLSVLVIEKDPSLAHSSTMLSDGNIRVQFNLEENILMSKFGFECINDFRSVLDIGDDAPVIENYRTGNLFLIADEGREAAMAGLSNQHRLDCETEWLDMDEVSRRFPAASSDELVGGTFGADEGPVDPAAVVAGYRKSAVRRGVELRQGQVEKLAVGASGVTGAIVDGALVEADRVVVAAGAWSAQLLEAAGASVPVDPVMRTVYVVAGNVQGREGLPHLFLPSGAYIIPEHGDTFMMAWSLQSDPVGFDFTPAPRSEFYEVIWPEIVSVLPAFDNLEVIRSWAGLYAQNRLDANAILGEWPSIENLLVATGFSGHGYQHCHAMGRHLAELVTWSEPSIDLSRFGPERIISGAPYAEHAGRII